MSGSVTHAEATRRIHALAQQSLQGLPSGSRLTSMGPDSPVPCSDSDGAPPSTPVTIAAVYWVSGPADARPADLLGRIVDCWRGQGWQVKNDLRPRDQFATVASGGYAVNVQLTADGSRLSLSAESPCVPPAGA